MKTIAIFAAALLGLASCGGSETDPLGSQASATESATPEPAPPAMPAPAPADMPAATMTAPAPVEMPPATMTPPADPSAMAPAPAPAASEGTDFAELPVVLGKAFCERLFSCCGPSEAMTLVLGPQLTKENCPALAPYHFGDYFKKYTLSMVEKRVTYFPERVDACVKRLSERTCAQFGASLYPIPPSYYYPYYSSPVPAAAFTCDDLFAPAQQPGQLCQSDQECVDGFCVSTLGSDKRCQALSQLGQSCQSARCGPGLYCAGSICRKVGKEGDSCYDTYSATACEAGLYCAGGSYYSQGTCKPKLADGAVCGYSTHCQSGRCEYNYAVPTGSSVCTPAVQPPAAPPLACTGTK